MQSDPLGSLISGLSKDNQILEAIEKNWLTSSMLNKTGNAYELYGLEATRLWLIDKKSRTDRKGEINALLAVLEHFKQCPFVLEQPQVGRIVLKTLRSLPRLTSHSNTHTQRRQKR